MLVFLEIERRRLRGYCFKNSWNLFVLKCWFLDFLAGGAGEFTSADSQLLIRRNRLVIWSL